MSKDQLHGKQIEDQSVLPIKLVSGEYDYVVGPGDVASYQTIQAAVDQAVTDGGWSKDNWARIGVFDGTYTENVTIPAWMLVESVSSFFKQALGIGYKLDHRVIVVGTITYSISSGTFEDVVLRGMSIEPTTGPAIQFSGNFYKRLLLYGCQLWGSSDSNVVDYGGTTATTYLIAHESNITQSNAGYVVAQVTTSKERFLSYDSVLTGPSASAGDPVLKSNGGWIALFGAGGLATPGYIVGRIEIMTGSTGNRFSLVDVWFHRGSYGQDVVVDGTLDQTYSYFRNTVAAVYPTYVPVDIAISGTNASTFKEKPEGTTGDIRRFNGQRWSPVPVPALNGDYDIPALTTTADFQIAMTPAITQTPEHDVLVRVNGVVYKPARNQSEKATSPCYFSNDGSGTVTTIGSIVGGVDKLYWVGSISGFELAATDRIDLVYEV